jgi:hypothetical protein
MPLPSLQTPAPDAQEQEPTEAEAILSVCRKLRTKMAHLSLRDADGEPLYWQKGDGGTAVYWCLRTMECAGPDGGLAHATLCQNQRLCFEPITS